MMSVSAWCKQITFASSPTTLLFSHRPSPSLLPFLTLSPPSFKLSTTTTTTTTSSALRASSNTTTASSKSLESLSPLQQDQISLYVRALLQWNQRMNLTAVREEAEVMSRHVEDSLALLPPLKRSYLSHCCGSVADVGDDVALSLVDVGSGAGLPGLIFAIACPSWKVTLLESMQKRCLFLEHAVDLIGLTNVEILRERAENAGQCLDSRELFDVAVARAVAEMRTLVEYCLPLVRVGGLFVAAKGYDPQEEVRRAEKAIELMGASVLELCAVESEGPLGQRTAVICLKDRATPRKYPRPPGTPAKTPL